MFNFLRHLCPIILLLNLILSYLTYNVANTARPNRPVLTGFFFCGTAASHSIHCHTSLSPLIAETLSLAPIEYHDFQTIINNPSY